MGSQFRLTAPRNVQYRKSQARSIYRNQPRKSVLNPRYIASHATYTCEIAPQAGITKVHAQRYKISRRVTKLAETQDTGRASTQFHEPEIQCSLIESMKTGKLIATRLLVSLN